MEPINQTADYRLFPPFLYFVYVCVSFVGLIKANHFLYSLQLKDDGVVYFIGDLGPWLCHSLSQIDTKRIVSPSPGSRTTSTIHPFVHAFFFKPIKSHLSRAFSCVCVKYVCFLVTRRPSANKKKNKQNKHNTRKLHHTPETCDPFTPTWWLKINTCFAGPFYYRLASFFSELCRKRHSLWRPGQEAVHKKKERKRNGRFEVLFYCGDDPIDRTQKIKEKQNTQRCNSLVKGGHFYYMGPASKKRANPGGDSAEFFSPYNNPFLSITSQPPVAL